MKIVVLAGGTSTERNISLVSGKGIYNALKSKGHKVVLVDVFLGVAVDDVNNIYDMEHDWAADIEADATVEPDIAKIKSLREDGGKCFFGPNVLEICKQADVAFMALHGANGEDGRIQATLELLGVPFTGTDYITSAICMDKALTKKLFDANDIPNAKGYDSSVNDEPVDIGFPAIVKVNTGGSSVGVYIVDNMDEMKDAFDKAKKYDGRVVVEQFIKGREFTCGIIDGKALPIVEIAPKEGFYDLSNKYKAGATVEICPAPISKEKTEEIQAITEKVFERLHLRSYARIDFMMDEKENVYCLEVNTLPGMTPTSLLPQEAAAVGMDYPTLCEKLIEVSIS